MFEMAGGEVLTLSQDRGVIAYVAFFGGARKKVDREMETVPGVVPVFFDYQTLGYQLKSTAAI